MPPTARTAQYEEIGSHATGPSSPPKAQSIAVCKVVIVRLCKQILLLYQRIPYRLSLAMLGLPFIIGYVFFEKETV